MSSINPKDIDAWEKREQKRKDKRLKKRSQRHLSEGLKDER